MQPQPIQFTDAAQHGLDVREACGHAVRVAEFAPLLLAFQGFGLPRELYSAVAQHEAVVLTSAHDVQACRSFHDAFMFVAGRGMIRNHALSGRLFMLMQARSAYVAPHETMQRQDIDECMQSLLDEFLITHERLHVPYRKRRIDGLSYSHADDASANRWFVYLIHASNCDLGRAIHL